MYVPTIFKAPNEAVMLDLIKSEGFGALVTNGDYGIDANHLPFVYMPANADHPKGRLATHISRMNAASVRAEENECLVIFQGPHAYISPTWYPSRELHGRVQPSWYYACVHAYGKARIIHDIDWLYQHVDSMTKAYEGDTSDSWRMSEQPPDFTELLVRHIIGIEISVDRLVGKWQVGQQRNPADRQGILHGLAGANQTKHGELINLIHNRGPINSSTTLKYEGNQ